jgi:hypothetical protein
LKPKGPIRAAIARIARMLGDKTFAEEAGSRAEEAGSRAEEAGSRAAEAGSGISSSLLSPSRQFRYRQFQHLLFGAIDRNVCNYHELKEETLLGHK